jgi:hypothetical protein
MGGGNRGVRVGDVVHNAQHAQSASTRIHGVGCGGHWNFSDYQLDYPVDEEEEDEEDAAGRLLRRCWRYGMPRCTDR